MNNFCEGNLYNIQSEISHTNQPTKIGLEAWKKEVVKRLYQELQNQNIENLDTIIKKVFGKTLE